MLRPGRHPTPKPRLDKIGYIVYFRMHKLYRMPPGRKRAGDEMKRCGTEENFMKRWVGLAVACSVAALLSAEAAAQTVLRLGNDVAANTIQARANEKFAEEVGKRNIGIEVKVF